MFYSRPDPSAGWIVAFAVTVLAIILPALAGGGWIWLVDIPLTGLPKDGSWYDGPQAITIVAAALLSAPLLSWVIVPICVPLLRAALRRGYAGWGSAIIVAWAVGLPTVHIFLSGDITTEAPQMVPMVMTALTLQGLTAFGLLRLQGLSHRPAPHN